MSEHEIYQAFVDYLVHTNRLSGDAVWSVNVEFRREEGYELVAYVDAKEQKPKGKKK